MKTPVLILLLICSVLGSCSTKDDSEQFEVLPCVDLVLDKSLSPVLMVDELPSLADGTLVADSATDYPEMALRAGIEGDVLVSFNVTDSGEPQYQHVEFGIGGGADEASLFGVQSLTFSPAILNGDPVCARIYGVMKFELETSENIRFELLSLEEAEVYFPQPHN